MKNLLSIDTNAKTIKGQIFGFFTAIMYLLPYTLSGKNLCGFASKECAEDCLNTAGRGKFSNVQKARKEKTDLFLNDKSLFLQSLVYQITKLSKKYGSQLAIRLNGTSDIPFENLKIDGKNIFELFPSIQFYDYTKNHNRMSLNIPNYHLTYSRSETAFSYYQSKQVLKQGKNIAIVFSPEIYNELLISGCVLIDGQKYPIIDGDKNDLRFLDGFGIVALKAKGKALKSGSKFVVRNINEL